MKVNFDFPTEQIQVKRGILLKPGENDLPDEIALELVAGSDNLVAGTAKVNDISEEKARKKLAGKGLCTAVAGGFLKKKDKGGDK